jgi:hypothetical protein
MQAWLNNQISRRQDEQSRLRHKVAPRPRSTVQLAYLDVDAKGFGGGRIRSDVTAL